MSDTTMTPKPSQLFEITKADAGLKILSFEQSGVPVQVRPGAPTLVKSAIYPLKTRQSVSDSKGVNWSDLVSFPISSDTTMTPLNPAHQFSIFEFIRGQNFIFSGQRGRGHERGRLGQSEKLSGL